MAVVEVFGSVLPAGSRGEGHDLKAVFALGRGVGIHWKRAWWGCCGGFAALCCLAESRAGAPAPEGSDLACVAADRFSAAWEQQHRGASGRRCCPALLFSLSRGCVMVAVQCL